MPDRDFLDHLDDFLDETDEPEPAVSERCPHCHRDWHGLAITERMEQMRREYGRMASERERQGGEIEYAESAILGDYRYAADDSPVICPGATFIGPRPPTAYERMSASVGLDLLPWQRAVMNRLFDDGRTLHEGLTPFSRSAPQARWWRCENPNNELEWEVTRESGRERDWLGYTVGPTHFTATLIVRRSADAPPICLIDLRTDPGNGNYIRIERPDLESAPTAVEIYATSPPPEITGTWLDRDGNPPRPWQVARFEVGQTVAFEGPRGQIYTGVITGEEPRDDDYRELTVQMYPRSERWRRELGALFGLGIGSQTQEGGQ